ncbi:MAG: radical SAM protein [Nanoarchaeota archaeon]
MINPISYKLFRTINWPKKLPFNLTLGLTYRCNSKCSTCNIWRMTSKDELTLQEYNKIFKNLGKKAEWITFSGGEPFLRTDIIEIVKSAYNNCNPKTIVIPTNAILYQIIPKKVEEILKACPKTRITINLSLDGIGKKHEKIRGIKNNFEYFLRTYDGLKKLKHYKNFELGIHTVISRFNVSNIKEIYEYVSKNLDPDSYITEIAEQRVELDTIGMDITPNEKEYATAINYLIDEIKKRKFTLKQRFRIQYYNLVKEILAKKTQVIPCYAGFASAQIAPNGDVWTCCIRAQPMGNLRKVNYDFKKVWFSKRADELRKSIKNKECYCPLANASYSNLLINQKSLAKIIAKVLIGK